MLMSPTHQLIISTPVNHCPLRAGIRFRNSTINNHDVGGTQRVLYTSSPLGKGQGRQGLGKA